MIKISPQDGLSEKELGAFLDELFKVGTVRNGTEIWAKMSEEDKAWVLRIKRSLARIRRITNKNNENTYGHQF